MDILEKHFIKKRDLVTRSILGETIVVPIRTNAGDLDAIYTLNEVGTVIWDLLDAKSSVSQITILSPFTFDPGVDSVSGATITAVLIFDSLDKAKEIFQKLKKEGYIKRE